MKSGVLLVDAASVACGLGLLCWFLVGRGLLLAVGCFLGFWVWVGGISDLIGVVGAKVGDCRIVISFSWGGSQVLRKFPTGGSQVLRKFPTCRSVWLLVDAVSVACGLGLLCRFLEVGDCGLRLVRSWGFRKYWVESPT